MHFRKAHRESFWLDAWRLRNANDNPLFIDSNRLVISTIVAELNVWST